MGITGARVRVKRDRCAGCGHPLDPSETVSCEGCGDVICADCAVAVKGKPSVESFVRYLTGERARERDHFFCSDRCAEKFASIIVNDPRFDPCDDEE